MRTALDTNVLSAIWSREPGSLALAERLFEAKHQGALVVSAPVFAELLAHPGVTEPFIAEFLRTTGISLDFELGEAVWRESGVRFARCVQLGRKAKSPDTSRRILADFVIGAHALLRADRLMTFDMSRYKQDFPELRLL